VLPHIGSASSGARRATAELAVRNLLAGLNGEPLPAPLLPGAPIAASSPPVTAAELTGGVAGHE